MSEDTSNEGWSSEHYGFETEPVVEPPAAAAPFRGTRRRLMAASVLAVALVAGSGSFAASYVVTHDNHHRGARPAHRNDAQRPARGR